MPRARGHVPQRPSLINKEESNGIRYTPVKKQLKLLLWDKIKVFKSTEILEAPTVPTGVLIKIIKAVIP